MSDAFPSFLDHLIWSITPNFKRDCITAIDYDDHSHCLNIDQEVLGTC